MIIGTIAASMKPSTCCSGMPLTRFSPVPGASRAAASGARRTSASTKRRQGLSVSVERIWQAWTLPFQPSGKGGAASILTRASRAAIASTTARVRSVEPSSSTITSISAWVLASAASTHGPIAFSSSRAGMRIATDGGCAGSSGRRRSTALSMAFSAGTTASEAMKRTKPPIIRTLLHAADRRRVHETAPGRGARGRRRDAPRACLRPAS